MVAFFLGGGWLAENGFLSWSGLCLLNEKVDDLALPLVDVGVEQEAAPLVATEDGCGDSEMPALLLATTSIKHSTDDGAIRSWPTPKPPSSSALLIYDSFGTTFEWQHRRLLRRLKRDAISPAVETWLAI